MQRNAVSLCDKWLCHLTGSCCRSVLLKDDQRIVFESEELFFYRTDQWNVKLKQQIVQCPVDQKVSLGSFELLIEKMHPGMFCKGVLLFRDELVFGVDLESDGVLLMNCEGLSLHLKKLQNQF